MLSVQPSGEQAAGDAGALPGLPSAWCRGSLAPLMPPLGCAPLLFMHPWTKANGEKWRNLSVALKPSWTPVTLVQSWPWD